MARFHEFEASLLGMLVDKFHVNRERIADLLKHEKLDGMGLVRRAVEMQLADAPRLARVISQYWELPLVDVSFPYRHFLVHFNRSVDDLLELDLLPLEFAPDMLTVVSYYVPEADARKRLEESRGVALRLYVAEYHAVQEALLRLRQEVKRFRAAEPLDCDEDKELFCRVTAEGWPASVRETFAGGTIRVEFGKDHTLRKTVESVDPSEPAEVANLLVGKSMTTVVQPGADFRKLATEFLETVGYFEGELREAILKLRVAQMLFEPGDKEQQ
jgi:hypothetical protein